jgi:hypothetical protein
MIEAMNPHAKQVPNIIKVYAAYEVCMYAYGITEDGVHANVECISPPVPIVGWTVYVRGYETSDTDDDTWDEVHDQDFELEESALAQASIWSAQYGCSIDRY